MKALVIFAALAVSACSSYDADLQTHLEAERDFNSHQLYLGGLYAKYDTEYIADCIHHQLDCNFNL